MACIRNLLVEEPSSIVISCTSPWYMCLDPYGLCLSVSLIIFGFPIRLHVLFCLCLAFECDCPNDNKVSNFRHSTFHFHDTNDQNVPNTDNKRSKWDYKRQRPSQLCCTSMIYHTKHHILQCIFFLFLVHFKLCSYHPFLQ